MSAPDVSNLTVPQLKTLCKDRGLCGYSKLNKVALIEKLASIVPGSQKQSSASSINHRGAKGIASQSTNLLDEFVPCPPTVDQTVHSSSEASTLKENDTSLHSHQTTVFQLHAPVSSRLSLSGKKRPSQDSSNIVAKKRCLPIVTGELSPLQKDTRRTNITPIHSPSILGHVDNIANSLSAPLSLRQDRRFPSSRHTLSLAAPQEQSRSQGDQRIFKLPELPSKANPTNVTTVLSTVESHNSGAKRFRPLVVPTQPVLISELSSRAPALVHSADIFTADATRISLRYLESSLKQEIPLTSIRFPPSISQRKHVQKWALILSGLSNAERRHCVLVSRMLRYAVYLSASSKLSHDFAGKRLEQMTKKYSQSMFDMWPYLRIRQDEVALRMKAYRDSFIADFYKGFEPISRKLWTSPDNRKQSDVAIRFVLTRLWFTMSLNCHGNDSDLLYSVVINAQEVVEEVWSITVRSSRRDEFPKRTEVFYVLEPTCEVVGHSSVSSLGSSPASAGIPLRADWSAYIEQHSHEHLSKTIKEPLFGLVTPANYGEYDKGISTLWLKRILHEGDIGVAKRRVAVRYILACVTGNSVSGSWMSINDMAYQDSNSSLVVRGNSESKNQRVNMYLSAHHHVESVHFTTSDGKALHPALAVVQTIGREYFILRDNGMQIGCEEEGVAGVWMELIRCDCRGCPSL